MEHDSERYLLIDDDTTFSTVLARSFTRRGLTVAMAHSIEEALSVAKAFQPTRAVVDLKLGQDSGLHLIRPLLALDTRMEIVVLTGYSSIPTTVEAIKAGAVNYLTKPVDVRTILAAYEVIQNEETEIDELSPISLKRLEWEHIQRVLDEHDGNVSATARSLGMHRRTLQRKLQKRPVKG